MGSANSSLSSSSSARGLVGVGGVDVADHGYVEKGRGLRGHRGAECFGGGGELGFGWGSGSRSLSRSWNSRGNGSDGDGRCFLDLFAIGAAAATGSKMTAVAASSVDLRFLLAVAGSTTKNGCRVYSWPAHTHTAHGTGQ